MKALQYFHQAITSEQAGEDGSCLLALKCGNFEFAQLNTSIPTDHPYRYLVDEGERTAEVTGRL